MTSSLEIFCDLPGQPHVSRFLSAILKQGRVSHAYLFIGPEGTGKEAAALRLAAALCCEAGGCGSCPGCQRAVRGVHPDIEIISPAGEYIMIDQVRDINRRVALRPHESRARVFILRNAAVFNLESANAFLKTLEEPPSFVYFLLLAQREDMVLPTLVSRCQLLKFSPLPVDEIEKYLTQHFEIKGAQAKAYARLSAGNLKLAVKLCKDGQLVNRRLVYIQLAQNLSKGAWEGGVSQIIAEVTAAADPGASTKAAAGSGDVPAGFITAPKKKIEEDARRRARSRQNKELAFALDVMESWFRDMMVTAAGAGETVLNQDFELELSSQALPSRIISYTKALKTIKNARLKLGYNVDMELAIQAMFLELQEVL